MVLPIPVLESSSAAAYIRLSRLLVQILVQACTMRCLLDGTPDGACSGNAGGIRQTGWQGLQGPLRRGSIEGLPQLPLLQLM